MTAKHTQGPWVLENGTLKQDTGNRKHLGTFSESVGLGHEAKANAKLIAAAPTLLAALQQIERLAREANADLVDVRLLLADIASNAINQIKEH